MIAFLTRRTLWIALIGSLGFNLGVLGTAAARYSGSWVAPAAPCGGGVTGSSGCHDSLESLPNLSAEQVEAIRNGCKTLKQRNREICRSLHTENERLVQLMTAEQVDAAAIDRQLEMTSDLRNQLQFNVIEYYLDVRKLLRADQMDAFRELIHGAVLQHGKHPGHGQHEHGKHSENKETQ